MNKAFFCVRIVPFAVASWLGLVAPVFAAELKGLWLFVDDGSGVEIGPCPIAANGLCGTLVQLPKSAASIAAAERKQLCGMTLLGELKAGKPKKDELLRLDGWVLNPEDLAQTDKPKRYDASLIMISEVSARLDVRGPFSIVMESHKLKRALASPRVCE